MDILQSPANGKNYLVKESKRSHGIPCTREHHEKGIAGDEAFCTIVLAAKDKVWVTDAFVGSGNDAYLFVDREDLGMIGENDDDLPLDMAGYALHQIVGTGAAILRDMFDQNKELTNHLVWLRAPSPSQTRSARRDVDRARREKLRMTKANTRTIIVAKDTTATVVKKTSPLHKVKQLKAEQEKDKLPIPIKTKRRNRMQRLNVPRRQRAQIIHT